MSRHEHGDLVNSYDTSRERLIVNGNGLNYCKSHERGATPFPHDFGVM